MRLRNFEKKLILTFSLIFVWVFTLYAQELDAKVKVFSQKVTGVERSVFNNLQQNLNNILNTTTWTSSNKIKKQGKIPCSFMLTIDGRSEDNTYTASLQVQANRLVFNSSYSTPLLNHKDKQVTFRLLPNESLQYANSGKNNELVAIVAYYAYLIIGLDQDSFSRLGGTRALKKAQRIVLQQGGSSVGGGWAATDRKANRYWIVEDLLNHKELREVGYTYHREGLDLMAANPQEGLKNMVSSIKKLEKVYNNNSDIVVLHVFFDAKAKEVAESCSVLPEKERKKLHLTLARIAPGHLGNFKGLE